MSAKKNTGISQKSNPGGQNLKRDDSPDSRGSQMSNQSKLPQKSRASNVVSGRPSLVKNLRDTNSDIQDAEFRSESGFGQSQMSGASSNGGQDLFFAEPMHSIKEEEDLAGASPRPSDGDMQDFKNDLSSP